MNSTPQTITIFTEDGPIITKSKQNPIADLVKQLQEYAKELFDVSASVQRRAKGTANYYGIKRKRQFLKRLTKFLPTIQRIEPIHVYNESLQKAADYLAKFATNESMLAQFCQNHADDLAAFDAALRLVEDMQQDTGETWTWWKPSSGTTPRLTILSPRSSTPQKHFTANLPTWRARFAKGSGKKLKRGRTSK